MIRGRHDPESAEPYRRHFTAPNVARRYGRDRFLLPGEAMIFLRHAEAIRGRDVLDIGCGAGRTTRYLAPLAGRYVGCDFAPAMVDRCRALHPGADIRLADARTLNGLGEGRFDFALFSYNGIDAMDHADRLRVLAAVRRVLRPGGLFVFSSHNRAAMPRQAHPVLDWSGNPCRMLANTGRWLLSWRNYRANRGRHRQEADYCQSTDRGGAYSLLHYYIDPPTQFGQAVATGFVPLGAYDANEGLALRPGDPASGARHVYYVLSRPGDVPSARETRDREFRE